MNLSKIKNKQLFFTDFVNIWWMLIGFSFLFRIAWLNIFNPIGIILVIIDIKKNGYKKNEFLLPILLWFIAYFIATLFTTVKIETSLSGFGREIWRFVPFFISFNLLKYIKYKIFLFASIFSLIIIQLINIGEFVAFHGRLRSIGVGQGAIHEGIISTAFVSYFLSLFLFKEKKKVYFLYIMIGIVSLLTTITRGAWIALVVTVIYLYIKRYKIKGIITAIIFLIIFSLIIFISTPLKTRVKSIYTGITYYENTGKAKGSVSTRLYIWEKTIEKIPEKVFLGWGPRSFKSTTKIKSEDQRKGKVRYYSHPHNNFLYLIFETGFVGLIAYLFLWIFIWKKITEKEKKNTGEEIGNIIGIKSIIITFWITGLFDTTMRMTYIVTLLFYYIIILLYQKDTTTKDYYDKQAIK